MDIFDDKSYFIIVVYFFQLEFEDIVIIKIKFKGERVFIKGVIYKVNESMMKVVFFLNFYIFQLII